MLTGLVLWLAVAVIVTIAASLLVDRFRKGDTENERSKGTHSPGARSVMVPGVR